MTSEDTGSWAEDYRDDHLRRRPPESPRNFMLRRHGHADAVTAVVLLLGWVLVVQEVVDVSSDAVAFLLLLVGLAFLARALVYYVAMLEAERRP